MNVGSVIDATYPLVRKFAHMAQPPSRRRALVTFSEREFDQIFKEAKRRGLKLASYLRTLIFTHPERAGGASNR